MGNRRIRSAGADFCAFMESLQMNLKKTCKVQKKMVPYKWKSDS